MPNCASVTHDCPKGYMRKGLVEIATACNVTVKRTRPTTGFKNMRELCAEVLALHDGKEEKDPIHETTETFGMTMEQIVCEVSGITSTINPKRINKTLVQDPVLRTMIATALERMPKVAKHIGGENQSADFVLINGKTLSLKTNLSSNRKVCPQTIGQITKQKFITMFKGSEVKATVYHKKSQILHAYLDKTFICDYTLWVYSKGISYETLLLDKHLITNRMFDHRNISFTKTLAEWNESNTVKYDGTSIGEFQVHNHRNIVKFRFHLDKLLTVLDRLNVVYQLRPQPVNHQRKARSF